MLSASAAPNRDDVAAAFAGAIAPLEPISDRQGHYDYLPVRVRTYVTAQAWPELLVSSVRAVVFRGGAVVVVRLRDGHRHVIPGGRREPGESVEQAVRREVLEECGWRLRTLKPLGFEHVRHLGEAPATHPAAGFVNPLYVAEAASYDRSARDLTQSEVGSSLVPIGRALRELPEWLAALLRAAVAAR